MSLKLIDPNSAWQALVDDGFHVEIRDQHLLMHNVPFVKSDKSIGRGTLICTYFVDSGVTQPPDNHQVWWTEDYPCFANGMAIEQLRNEDGEREILPGVVIRHRFSNKPDQFINGFSDHYSKLTHYARLLQAQAAVIVEGINAQTGVESVAEQCSQSPFAYSDTASARASVLMTSSKLTGLVIGIVGVGGTGGYVLDQVAKTPVASIHLFDADTFEQHNAFRAPGAASLADIKKNQQKVDYFSQIYSKIHTGVYPHPYKIDVGTVNELDRCDFVFLCVDHGMTRALAGNHLISRNIPFVDVGMNLHQVAKTNKLIGTCRTTLCTSGNAADFSRLVPLDNDDEDILYRQNIQISDMNAINAQFAVMMWKQYFGFYQDDFGVTNLTFSLNTMSLVRSIKAPSV